MIQTSLCPRCQMEGFHVHSTGSYLMPNWTKADIDELVEGVPVLNWYDSLGILGRKDFRQVLYLAAGLTAGGEPKPKKRRMHIYTYDDGRCPLITFEEVYGLNYHRHISGWFTPDGTK